MVAAAAIGAGYTLGLSGVPIPMVESGILASVLVFGLLTATAARLPAALVAPVIAAFMVLHGHAHGSEAPTGAAMLYAAGFVAASVVIVTVAFGGVHLVRHLRREAIVRWVGASIGGTGAIIGFLS